jgi:hypothetical protein
MNWLEEPKDLSEAMAMVPLMEAFAKAVKSAVKAKLKEEIEIPGFKLRSSGNMTSYEASKVAEQLMESNLINWEDLLESMKFSIEGLVPVWAEKTEQTIAEARKDLKSRLSDIAKTKPKSSSIARIK